jgi:NADPH:quinone reductase-like Zn-dependent oxidoreductase
MKAVLINKYGHNNVVEIKDLSRPVPGPNEVLIKVRAAGVNPVDWKIREGMLRSAADAFPMVLGRECAGEVVETGAAVKEFKNGDQVIAIPSIRKLGSFAEFAVASEQTVYPKPGNISFEEAAAIPIAGLTALRALRDAGGISADKKTLIVGASGGVGHFGVQIAKVFGAEVTAVCKGANAGFVRSLGADTVIDYIKEDFTKGSLRYDIIFDAVAKRTFEECRNVLSPNGIYVSTYPIGGATEDGGKKAKTVPGGPTKADMDWMKSRIEEGKIRVAIDKVFPLDQAKEALAYSETEQARGKIVLKAA